MGQLGPHISVTCISLCMERQSDNGTGTNAEHREERTSVKLELQSTGRQIWQQVYFFPACSHLGPNTQELGTA